MALWGLHLVHSGTIRDAFAGLLTRLLPAGKTQADPGAPLAFS